ncbi:permease [Nodosilinea sp. AN01ver1]|uniref:permease n=1 Tax=Nodosilinea sp. AN01ver1 TaxID=3423362 RepID=UPI003D319D0B
MNQIAEAFLTSAGILWKALWALVFGYLISAAIQVLVTRSQMARLMGKRGPKRAALASLFGFVSSSCSFAALAASRSILVKGAHPVNAIAFLIASTNLVIELGIVLWILMGWQFVLGNFLLGVLMILYAYLIARTWFPKQLADAARAHAEQQQSEGMQHDMSNNSDSGWWQKITSLAGWQAIASAFFMEWKMAYKEILFGFTIAGFISVFVPQSFWNSLFLNTGSDATSWLVVLENAAIAPVIAFFTFIGSMGNVPLAAMLWGNNASFGGVMSFLGADLVAATVLYLQSKYYGWSYTGYLAALLYTCMVAAGLTTHAIFAVLVILPTERPGLGELVRFQIDYTFWLNIVFIVVGLALVYLHWKSRQNSDQESHDMA